MSRAVVVSLTAMALSCTGVAAAAAADGGPGKGKPPAHAQAGGHKAAPNKPAPNKPAQKAKPKAPPQDRGHQGSRGHAGDPGHQGSRGQQGPAAAPGGGQHDDATPQTPGSAAKGGQHNPPGNNGTIKIEQLQADGVPQNNPHPGCQLRVEWYGFDEGDDVVSEVSFAAIAPTAGSTISVDGDTSVPVGGDAASGAGTDTGLDGSEVYTLSFTGAPHAQQGYHVKVTVHTPHSLGNDSKTKVFWVEPCTTDVVGQPGGLTPGTGAPTAPTGAPGTTGLPGTTGVPGTTGTPGTTGLPGTTGTPGAAGTSGTTALRSGADVATATPGDDADSVPVPTSVAAGSEGSLEARDLLPIGLLTLGGSLTAAAAYRRRRATLS